MHTKTVARILFTCLIAALLFGLGSGCVLYKKEKNFFLNAVPGSQNCVAV